MLDDDSYVIFLLLDFSGWQFCEHAPTFHLSLNFGYIKGSEFYQTVHAFHDEVETNLDLTKSSEDDVGALE